MHSKSAQQVQQSWCFAVSISGPDGVAAAQHKDHHDRPPLAGLPRSACQKANVFAYPFAVVSGSEAVQRVA